jgi:CRISPR-associated protein Csm3
MEKLYKKIIITGTLTCVTGLHIGDSKDSVEIGGLDGPVVRRKDNNQPYIPGSSLKGKMRSLLQQATGETAIETASGNETGFQAGLNAWVAPLFGGTDSRAKKPNTDNKEPLYAGHGSRLLVRDAYLTTETVNWLKDSEHTDMPYTEQKYENTIDRKTGTTVQGGVRNQERVPAGAKFDIEFVLNIFANDETVAKAQEQKFMAIFNLGIELLQNDYIGGSGSRGYGQILIKKDKIEYIDIQEKIAALTPSNDETPKDTPDAA